MQDNNTNISTNTLLLDEFSKFAPSNFLIRNENNLHRSKGNLPR